MSNVISFLEQMGRNPALAGRSPEAYANAVDALALDDAPRQALLDRDAGALNDLLGGRLKMMCFLFPAEGDEQKNNEEPDGDGETPAHEDDKKEAVRHGSAH